MANTTWTVSSAINTESDFRTWWKSWRTAFAAVGMVRVDDDGTDPDVALPTLSPVYGSGTNREITWEVWRFPTGGDSVQTTSPLFLRVGYGQAASSSAPRMQFVIGTGAGTGGAVTPANGIGGTTGNGTVISASPGGSGTQHWMSCDGNGLAIVYGANTGSSNARVIVVDRIRNPATGLPRLTASNVSVGVVLAVMNLAASGAIVGGIRVLDPTENYADTATNTNVPCIVTPGTMSLVATYPNANGQTQLYPWWASAKNGSGALKMIASYNRAELGGLGTEVDAAWMPSTDPTRKVKLLADWGFGFDWTGSSAAAAAIWWAD